LNLGENESDGDNVRQIKSAIRSDLENRFEEDIAKMLQEAAFLDPTFKKLNFLSQDENTDTIEGLS